jgi:hypothetical protein
MVKLLQDYMLTFPAHHNMEDYTDKYGICHVVVEKEELYAKRRLKLVHYST